MNKLILAEKFKSLNPQTKKAAAQAVKGFNGFLKNTFQAILFQGRSLNALLKKMQFELGKGEGKVTFECWLNSQEWQQTGTLAKTLMTVAKRFDKLPGTLKNQLRESLNGWSLSAIKELLSAGRDIIYKLKNRPTSAAAVRKAKERAKLLERQLNEDIWEEIIEAYDVGENLETIKEQAQKLAAAEKTPPKYKHLISVLNKLGIPTVALRPKKDRKTQIATDPEIIHELASLAVRNSELRESLGSAPQEVAESIARQIKSNDSRIKQLRTQYNLPQQAVSTSGNNFSQNIHNGERVVQLEQLVEILQEEKEKLEKKLQELVTLEQQSAPDKENKELARENRRSLETIKDLKNSHRRKDALIDTLLSLERIKVLEPLERGMEVVVIQGKEIGTRGAIADSFCGTYTVERIRGYQTTAFSKKANQLLILNPKQDPEKKYAYRLLEKLYKALPQFKETLKAKTINRAEEVAELLIKYVKQLQQTTPLTVA